LIAVVNLFDDLSSARNFFDIDLFESYSEVMELAL
jgi:hypothetical protein